MAVQFGLTSVPWSDVPTSAALGKTRDVSGEGICLETNTVMRDRTHVLAEAMTTEKPLFLFIEIPDREPPVEVLGRVIWYDLAPQDSDFRFRAGVLFTNMGDDVRKEWQDFLSAAKRKKRS